jgi:CHAT domain-containing protein
MSSGVVTSGQLDDAGVWISKLASLDEECARRDYFLAEPRAHRFEIATQLYAEALQLAYVDVDRAARLSQAGEWLAELLDDESARAMSLRSRGHLSFARGQYGEALECYQAAIARLEALGHDLDLGRTLTSALQALSYLGRYDQALQWAERARVIFERHSDELRLARLRSNMGNILFRQDRYSEALQNYEEAQEPLARLGEPRDLAAVLSNMAVCCTSLGRFPDAVAFYNAARAHCVKYGLPLLVAAADYNIAYLYYQRGDYVKAMHRYTISRANAERAGDSYHAALCDLDESEMYLELNLTAEAAQLAGRAAQEFERLGMNYERAKAIVNQAMAASHTGDLVLAHRQFRMARRLFSAEQNDIWCALIDLYQAILRYRQGNYVPSRKLSRKAARVLTRVLAPGKAALCQLVQAQLTWKEGRAATAREECLQILEHLDSGVSPALRFHVNFVLGQVEEDLEHWDSAWNAYQDARQEIENLRSRLSGDDLKISILKDKLTVYESLVWLALWRKTPDETAVREAFLLAEQAKSRSLADQIAFPAPTSGQNSEHADDQIQELRRDLNWHYRQIELAALLSRSGIAARVEGLRQQARQTEEQLVRSLQQLRSGAGAVDPSPGQGLPDFDAILASVPPEAVLIEYYEVRGILYACLLSRDRLRMLPLAPSSRVRDLIRLLQFQLAKFRLGPEYQRTFSGAMLSATLAHLEALHRELIEPLKPLFGSAEHLLIAPHGFLHNCPFHALRSGSRYLLDDFTISYTPSASVFALCRARPSSFRDESLVMGIPDQATPHIEGEVRYTASALPNSRLFLGPEASSAVLREYGPSSRFIHIATHGLFRRDNPMFSSIRLGDSHLSLFDLYQLPLSAELVTLSGCSTGLNVVVGGDELVGLMRGLLYAGTQGILVSLWDVHDRSTAEFMTAFYQRFQQKSSKAEALRAAMTELRESYPHPYHWAPFTLVGKYAS